MRHCTKCDEFLPIPYLAEQDDVELGIGARHL